MLGPHVPVEILFDLVHKPPSAAHPATGRPRHIRQVARIKNNNRDQTNDQNFRKAEVKHQL